MRVAGREGLDGECVIWSLGQVAAPWFVAPSGFGRSSRASVGAEPRVTRGGRSRTTGFA